MTPTKAKKKKTTPHKTGGRATTTAATTTLQQFLATTGTLTAAQRGKIVDQAETMLDALYVHLPLKRVDARHRSVAAAQAASLPSRRHVGAAVPRRDARHLHRPARSAYELRPAQPLRHEDRVPAVPARGILRGRQADLPRLEDAGRLHARNLQTRGDRHQLERRADRSRGRDECRSSGGQQSGRPPRPRPRGTDDSGDGDVVATRRTLGHRRVSRRHDDARIAPRLAGVRARPRRRRGGGGGAAGRAQSKASALDLRTELARRAKKALFNPQAMATERAGSPSRRADRINLADTSTMPDVFCVPHRGNATPARTATSVSGRSWSNDEDAFVDEFVRMAGLLPQNRIDRRRSRKRRRQHPVRGEAAPGADAGRGRAVAALVHQFAADASDLQGERLRRRLGAVDRAGGGNRRGVFAGLLDRCRSSSTTGSASGIRGRWC